jgi:hypothetical protein
VIAALGAATVRRPAGWISYAGPGGCNDLDSIDVGNGAMDGLTPDERRSYLTLWAISAAPLYTGDDITRLDRYGLSLLTNREVSRHRPAGPAGPVAQYQGEPTGGHQPRHAQCILVRERAPHRPVQLRDRTEELL